MQRQGAASISLNDALPQAPVYEQFARSNEDVVFLKAMEERSRVGAAAIPAALRPPSVSPSAVPPFAIAVCSFPLLAACLTTEPHHERRYPRLSHLPLLCEKEACEFLFRRQPREAPTRAAGSQAGTWGDCGALPLPFVLSA